MSRRPPKATKRQGEFASRMASDFEEAPLHNTIHDRIGEDDQLAVLLDTEAEGNRAWQLREDYLGPDAERLEDIYEAAATIGHVGRDRALEVVAETCAEVIKDGDQWVDEGHWSQTTMDGAKKEAREWLSNNTNAASRAGVLGVLNEGGA